MQANQENGTVSHAIAIEKNFDVLRRCTDVNDFVIVFLRAAGVLDNSQNSIIGTERNHLLRITLLYNWLKECQDVSKYMKFLGVMEHNNVQQEHVANLLRGNTQGEVVPLSGSIHQRLVRICPRLVDAAFGFHIGVELLTLLRSTQAISNTDYDDINTENAKHKKGILLMTAIMRRSNKAFDQFRQALIQTKQKHFADFLLEGEMPVTRITTSRPDLYGRLSVALNNAIIEDQVQLNQLKGFGLHLVAARERNNIEVFVYCRKMSDMETFITALNSNELGNMLCSILNRLLLTIEPENTGGIQANISIDEGIPVVALKQAFQATGRKKWIKELPIQEDASELKNQTQMEDLPLEMIDMILLKAVQGMMVKNSSEAFKSFDELMYQVLHDLRTISFLWDRRLQAKKWVKARLQHLRKTSNKATKNIADCYAIFVKDVELSTVRSSLTVFKVVERQKLRDIFDQNSKNEDRCREFLDHLFTKGHPLAFLALRQVLEQNKTDILDYMDGRKMCTMTEEGSVFLSNEEIKEIVSRGIINDQLMADMDPDRLGDWLKQGRVITIKEWQENIASSDNIKDRRHAILEYLSTNSHPRAYIILRQVLIQDNPNIASAIDNVTAGNLCIRTKNSDS